jgi:FkbM family methyltransferase
MRLGRPRSRQQQGADEARIIEKSFHINKLALLEVAPLYPFLYGRERLDVIELGGNVGLWCEAFHDVFGHRVGSYVSYEPMPGNVARFRRRLQEHMGGARVNLVQKCVGSEKGEVTLHYDKEVTTLASVVVPYIEFRKLVIDNKYSRRVPQVRLDDEVTGHVDLVKVDTEGYEWDVLQGARGVIDSELVDNVYFEFGAHQGHLGQSFQQFFDFFAERGWKVFRQTVSRNYFGLNEVRRYEERLEDFSSMWMILASRLGIPDDYRGPRVFGRFN